MSEYHKIHSIYMRNPASKHKTFLEGQFSLPEFEYLQRNEWLFEEKVDGTNIRVYFDPETQLVRFGGRTEAAQIPTTLYARLSELFFTEKMLPVFKGPVCIYGEGYGARIQQGGGNYIPDGVDFIMFDVKAGDVYLRREDVKEIAAALGVKYVPEVGRGTLLDAVEMCKQGFASQLRKTEPEGLVIRPTVELRCRRGERIITKLKLRDFRNGQEKRSESEAA